MAHRHRTLGLLRSAIAVLLCGLGLAVAPSLAGASSGAFVIGGSSLNPESAAAQQNSDRDGNKDVKCASGTFMHAVYVVPGTWGTYPTIAGIGFQCIGPDGSEPTPSWFGSDAYSYNIGCPRGSSGILDALTGLKVNVDRYVKDFKARCGSISTSGDVVDVGYQDDWALDKVQDNDTKTALTCPTGDVVTGLRIGYKKKSNGVYGFTSVWLWCSGVGPAPSTTGGTTTTARPGGIVKKPLPKPRPATPAPRVTTPTTPKRPGTATVKR